MGIRNKIRGAVQRFAPASWKRVLWNREFSGGRWDYLRNTAGDPLYPVLERYVASKSILDLGCGSGTTALELPRSCSSHYLGVDISDVAVQTARRRTGRTGSFIRGDITTYVPAQPYDVILFRDSIYYVPETKILPMLERYGRSLSPSGVFVVRMYHSGHAVAATDRIINEHFQIAERLTFTEPLAIILVFRPRHAASATAAA